MMMVAMMLMMRMVMMIIIIIVPTTMSSFAGRRGFSTMCGVEYASWLRLRSFVEFRSRWFVPVFAKAGDTKLLQRMIRL
eukprot:4659762-Amphidinium_carterae.1